MITAIKNTNSDLYKDLFAKASEVLSGYERTQTFDENKTYFYKDSKTNTFTELVFQSATKEGKIIEFADALATYGYLYVSNGKDPSSYNFAPELGITTLEEYYNWLPEIKRDSKGNPTIFTKLPLDEAHFEINPNTRAITIPAEFKKNGIAVQGDDLAEVVYFMIDRFFDAMDLNNTEIYIEWETPKSKTGGGVKSVSETYLKMIDDENYPGKLIFGWAISDAITKDSGTLKFAVRFVQWNDEDKIVYSFNTLTAQATIHPNLGLDLENDSYDVDNCNDRLLERIEPSVVVGGAQAAVPYFLQDIVMLDEGYDIIPNHIDGTYSLSVVATADDTGAVSYVWKRSEIGEDAWVEVPGSTAVDFVELTEKEYEDFEWKLPENRVYHIERSDETAYLLPKGYYDLTDAATKAWFKTNLNVDIDAGEIPHLFEKRSVLVVEKYGQYKAEARNRIFNSLTKASSKVATFKTPDSVVMDNKDQTTDKHIIGTESAVLAPVVVEAVGDLSYEWLRASEKDNSFLKTHEFKNLPDGVKVSTDENTVRIAFAEDTEWFENEASKPGSYRYQIHSYIPSEAAYYTYTAVRGANVEITAPNTEKQAIDDINDVGTNERGAYVISNCVAAQLKNGEWKDFTELQPDLDYGTKGNTIMIEWYNAADEKIGVDLFNVEYYKPANFKEVNAFEPVDESVAGARDSVLIATEPGMYKLKVTRTRNRATTDGTSIEYRVTNAPEVPEFVAGTYDALEIIPVNDLLAGIKTLSVEWKDNVKSDEFYVAWYLYRGDKKMDDLNIVTYKISNAFKSEFNPADVAHAPVFEAAGEDIEGYYYAVVKNKLNGVESAYNEKPEQDKMFSVTGS